MDFELLLNLSLMAVAICSLLGLWHGFSSSRHSARLVEALGNTRQGSGLQARPGVQPGKNADSDFNARPQLDIEDIKTAARRRPKLSSKTFWKEKFFRAGYFTKHDIARFQSIRILCLAGCPLLSIFLGSFVGFSYAALAGGLGLLIGWKIPLSYLDRVIAKRDYEILFYLPLVVEQLVIGVSSSLDIGPCIQGVVTMSTERDSHSPVTELLRYVQHYIKTGASMEEALTEVGRLSCHTELKHTFMALAQVSRHGGEITRQLQQLADSVALQRETSIDARIKKLELEATGPVGLVFLAFMGILLVGLGAQIALVFQQ